MGEWPDVAMYGVLRRGDRLCRVSRVAPRAGAQGTDRSDERASDPAPRDGCVDHDLGRTTMNLPNYVLTGANSSPRD
eukprot:5458823-Pleurochrysis_carterae.AAC.5